MGRGDKEEVGEREKRQRADQIAGTSISHTKRIYAKQERLGTMNWSERRQRLASMFTQCV